MGKVINLADEKFQRGTAGKIVKATAQMDKLFEDLVVNDDVKAHELIYAMAHRIGVYLSYTDCDPDKTVKKLAKLIYKQATIER